ncbi:MAG: hypothetical protein A2Z37_13925 [Chloroflexi bacterium RBG_19FT_COMBO_62_14]|nr:MAG: hypothetical protein A2Z37_13925 [Chloroflexi bacterium RBG_19FT_COMBO_62_14]
MIPVTSEERQWFLSNLALGLVEYMGVAEPPVPVEEILKHPPSLYESDFGVVDMYSNLWDATFARPPTQRGSVFVRIDLPPDERRFALAREMLSALITSKHGRAMGLSDFLMTDLRESAEFFARKLLMPETLVTAFRRRKGRLQSVSETFQVPPPVASMGWDESSAALN